MNTFFDQRVLERLRAEYLEMPGMKLRIEQVQRLWNRADDAQTGPRRAREVELSVPKIRRDVRSVDGRQFASPTAAAGEVDMDRDDIPPGEPGSMRRAPDLVTSPTGEPGRPERRQIPPCPMCDATHAERILAVAPESRLRWFRCRGCGHLWNIAPPITT